MKNYLAVVMGCLYIAAGINHFVHPEFYLKIMPTWLGNHKLLVQLSGVAEVLLGILVVLPRFRIIGAWGLIMLLIAVFPANIQMLINYINWHHPGIWLAVIRLPFQVVLIWWAWIYTDKPAQRRHIKI